MKRLVSSFFYSVLFSSIRANIIRLKREVLIELVLFLVFFFLPKVSFPPGGLLHPPLQYAM